MPQFDLIKKKALVEEFLERRKRGDGLTRKAFAEEKSEELGQQISMWSFGRWVLEHEAGRYENAEEGQKRRRKSNREGASVPVKTGDNDSVDAEAHALDEDTKKLQSLQQEAEENLFGMGPTDFLSIVNANGWLTDNVIDKYSALINKVC